MRFCDIQNKQGQGKCYQLKQKGKADYMYTTKTLIIPDITKTKSNNNLLYYTVDCFKGNHDK